MVNKFQRWVAHACHGNRSLRRRFTPEVMVAIEQAVRRAEQTHGGEIRFVVEASLASQAVWAGWPPRQRAEDVFAQLRVWDTENNNGVLIYVLLADRDVEILADRGLNKKITPAEWESVCRQMETYYRNGDFKSGSLAGIEAVGQLIGHHFPPRRDHTPPNELPDVPTVL